MMNLFGIEAWQSNPAAPKKILWHTGNVGSDRVKLVRVRGEIRRRLDETMVGKVADRLWELYELGLITMYQKKTKKFEVVGELCRPRRIYVHQYFAEKLPERRRFRR